MTERLMHGKKRFLHSDGSHGVKLLVMISVFVGYYVLENKNVLACESQDTNKIWQRQQQTGATMRKVLCELLGDCDLISFAMVNVASSQIRLHSRFSGRRLRWVMNIIAPKVEVDVEQEHFDLVLCCFSWSPLQQQQLRQLPCRWALILSFRSPLPIKCSQLDGELRDKMGCMGHEIDAEKEEAASLTSCDTGTPWKHFLCNCALFCVVW